MSSLTRVLTNGADTIRPGLVLPPAATVIRPIMSADAIVKRSSAGSIATASHSLMSLLQDLSSRFNDRIGQDIYELAMDSPDPEVIGYAAVLLAERGSTPGWAWQFRSYTRSLDHLKSLRGLAQRGDDESARTAISIVENFWGDKSRPDWKSEEKLRVKMYEAAIDAVRSSDEPGVLGFLSRTANNYNNREAGQKALFALAGREGSSATEALVKVDATNSSLRVIEAIRASTINEAERIERLERVGKTTDVPSKQLAVLEALRERHPSVETVNAIKTVALKRGVSESIIDRDPNALNREAIIKAMDVLATIQSSESEAIAAIQTIFETYKVSGLLNRFDSGVNAAHQRALMHVD